MCESVDDLNGTCTCTTRLRAIVRVVAWITTVVACNIQSFPSLPSTKVALSYVPPFCWVNVYPMLSLCLLPSLPSQFSSVDNIWFPKIPPYVRINRSNADVVVTGYSYLPMLSLSLSSFNRKLYLFWLALKRKHIDFISSTWTYFSLYDSWYPTTLTSWLLLSIFFSPWQLHGLIDIIPTQFESIVWLIFSLSQVNKTSDAVI